MQDVVYDWNYICVSWFEYKQIVELNLWVASICTFNS